MADASDPLTSVAEVVPAPGRRPRLGVDWRAPATDRDASWGPVGVVLAIAVVLNVLTNRVLPESLYVPTCLGGATLLLVVARHSGLDAEALGLDRRNVATALRWGLLAMTATLAVLLVGLVVPGLRGLFRDERVAGDPTVGGWAFHVLWQIPLGTVILEELLFRSVLLAALHRRWSLGAAVTATSALFGFWHVLPSLGLSTSNELVAGVDGGVALQVAGVAVAVVSTFLFGYVFAWVRLRGRHVLASMLLHSATNMFSFTLAWLVVRSG